MEKHKESKESIGENCQNGILNAKTSGTPRPNVPALRFPEFTDEWKEVLFASNLERLENGANYNTNDKDGVPMSRIETISTGRIDYTKVGHCSTPQKIEHYIMRYGDILFSHINSLKHIGKTAYYSAEEPLYHGMNLLLFRCKNNVDSKFFFFLINNTHFIRKCQILAKQAVNQASISTSDLKKIKVYIPDINEQSKIQKFLSLIEKRIELQNKIIEDLKKLKSAIIDKLYSSTNGEIYSFRQLFEVVNEKNKARAYKNVLSASQELGMIERSDINIDIKFEQESISGYKIVHKGDYVVHLRSFQGGFAFSDRTGICSPAYIILCPNDLVVYGYLSHFFTSKPFIKSLKLVTYGIRDGRSINVDEWLDMPILLPPAQEQIRILTIVNAIDAKLHNEVKVQFFLSSQKSYLLNTMFI